MQATDLQATFSPDSSQLDAVETTTTAHPPKSFSTYRQNQCPEEFTAALDLYAHLDNVEGSTRSERLLECRKYAWFTVHKTTREVRVASNACRLRWCPICAQARRNFIRQETRAYVLSLRKPKFLTLTTRHADTPLADQVEALYRHFRLFRQHKGLTSRLRGGCWFFQLKRGKGDGRWHPHIHCVLDSDYISKFDLSADWFQTTGDSYIVDIRSINDPEKVSDYVARYAATPCKMSDFTEADRNEAFTVLHGRRLCGVFGTGRSVSFRPRRTEDLTDWIRLESWHDVVHLSRFNATFRAVWQAYAASKPLTESEFTAVTAVDYLPNVPDYCNVRKSYSTQLELEQYIKR